MSQLASVLMAFVLSGTPALVMACATLCGSDMRMTASTPAPVPATPQAADVHAHHGHHVAAEVAEGTSHAAPAQPMLSVRISAEAAGCCPDLDTVVLTRALAAKAGVSGLAAPVLSQPALFALPAAVAHRLPAPIDRRRPSPARLPLVLRI